jgi:hypothetical protein
MQQNLSLLVTSVVLAIAGFYLTKYSYKPNSDWGYRGKISGPGLVLIALAVLYKALEGFFGW